jgi:hypothetical protein
MLDLHKPFPIEGREMRYRICHGQVQKPSVGHVHFDFLGRLMHAGDPEQILQQRDLDQHHWIRSRPALIRSVERFDQLVDKTEVGGLVGHVYQMIRGDPLLQAVHFEFPAVIFLLFRKHGSTLWRFFPFIRKALRKL